MSTTPRTDEAISAYLREKEFSISALVNLKLSVGQLETELTACTARLAEVERERDMAHHRAAVVTELRNACLQAIQNFMGSGAGDEEILQVIHDRIAAEAVLPEGEYEGADGMEDVVRWLKGERDTLAAENARLREALQFEAGDLDDDIIGIDACMRCSREHLVSRLNRIKEALNPKGGEQ